MKWMIVADEHTGNHLWVDEERVVGLEHGNMYLINDLADSKEVKDRLRELIQAPRKRTFLFQKRRCVVVARGTRYEP
jgi:hypothetical protein